MYDFYKVKGGKNHQEFRHPYFKRNYYKDLAFIKRKSVHKSHNELENNAENASDANDNVQEKLDSVKRSLEVVTAQNKNLIEANKEMIAKLYNFKGSYEVRLKKLFFVFMVLVHNYDEDLLEALRKPLEQLNIRLPGQDMQNLDISKYVKSLCRRLVSQEVDNQKLLDQLVDTFFGYFESKGSPIKRENFNWSNAHPNIDNFSISVFNADSMEGFTDTRRPFKRNYPSIRLDVPQADTGRPFLFRDTVNQNLLQSPSKPNEINFDDLNMNDDNGNVLVDKRDEDSFLMSGANSVLMLSPFKRNL